MNKNIYYIEGYKAFRPYDATTINPYSEYSKEYCGWQDGYEEAETKYYSLIASCNPTLGSMFNMVNEGIYNF
jgi:hypothetical protein